MYLNILIFSLLKHKNSWKDTSQKYVSNNKPMKKLLNLLSHQGIAKPEIQACSRFTEI